MMFKHLDEVKSQWDRLYEAEGMLPDFRMPSPGYSNEEIATLEGDLQLELHPSFRNVIQRFNFDTVRFADAIFSPGGSYLTYLQRFNRPYEHLPHNANFLVNIGGAGAHFLILNNNNGVIFAASFDNTTTLEHIAEHMDQLILRCASIAFIDYTTSDDWYDPEAELNRNPETDPVIRFVNDHNLSLGVLYKYRNEHLERIGAQGRFWLKFASRTV